MLFCYSECNELAKRGYRKAVRVFLQVGNNLKFVGSNMEVVGDSRLAALQIVRDVFGLGIDGHDFTSKDIEMKKL